MKDLYIFQVLTEYYLTPTYTLNLKEIRWSQLYFTCVVLLEEVIWREKDMWFWLMNHVMNSSYTVGNPVSSIPLETSDEFLLLFRDLWVPWHACTWSARRSTCPSSRCAVGYPAGAQRKKWEQETGHNYGWNSDFTYTYFKVISSIKQSHWYTVSFFSCLCCGQGRGCKLDGRKEAH